MTVFRKNNPINHNIDIDILTTQMGIEVLDTDNNGQLSVGDVLVKHDASGIQTYEITDTDLLTAENLAAVLNQHTVSDAQISVVNSKDGDTFIASASQSNPNYLRLYNVTNEQDEEIARSSWGISYASYHDEESLPSSSNPEAPKASEAPTDPVIVEAPADHSVPEAQEILVDSENTTDFNTICFAKSTATDSEKVACLTDVITIKGTKDSLAQAQQKVSEKNTQLKNLESQIINLKSEIRVAVLNQDDRVILKNIKTIKELQQQILLLQTDIQSDSQDIKGLQDLIGALENSIINGDGSSN